MHSSELFGPSLEITPMSQSQMRNEDRTDRGQVKRVQWSCYCDSASSLLEFLLERGGKKGKAQGQGWRVSLDKLPWL